MNAKVSSCIKKVCTVKGGIGILFFLFSCYVLYRNPSKSLLLFAIQYKIYSFIVFHAIYNAKKEWIHSKIDPILKFLKEFLTSPVLGIELYKILIFVALAAFYSWILTEILDQPARLRGVAGLFLLIGIATLCSRNISNISWRPVIGGITLQFVCGTVFLKWTHGNQGLQWLVEKVVGFLDLTYRGSTFVYGFATQPPPICDFSYVFVFTALQILIFFGAVVELLYYLGIIQKVLKILAWAMSHSVGTTGSESLNAAACIFVGQTEAALLVGESLGRLTASEIHTVMTTGFSCIAGSLFSAFIAFGACPSYLLTATLMSACVSLAFSKIICPETEESKDKEFDFAKSHHSNILECVSVGATKSARLVMAVGSNLLVFLALLEASNRLIAYSAELVGYQGLSLNKIIGWAFYPIAYMMGASDDPNPDVATAETMYVAELMGIKTVLNEFLAYKHLAFLISSGKLVGNRARMIATFACCGFSNISMIGSMLGTLGQLVPERKRLLAELVVRALISGILSCFATATVAGIIVSNPIGCLPSSNVNCITLNDLENVLSNQTSI